MAGSFIFMAFGMQPIDLSSTASLPRPQGLTYEDYVACIPQSSRYKLKRELDFEYQSTDLHLGQIAHIMVKWEMLATDLKLTSVDVYDIKANNTMHAELQRYKSHNFCDITRAFNYLTGEMLCRDGRGKWDFMLPTKPSCTFL